MLKATLNNSGQVWIGVFAVLMAAISVYYYFRVIQAMYFKEGNGQTIVVTPVFKWTMVLCAGLVILLGLFPNFLLYWLYF
jgi:NADH-quinone oxidoreductase subunit N